jgi:hypothetical protein
MLAGFVPSTSTDAPPRRAAAKGVPVFPDVVVQLDNSRPI